MCIVSNIFDRFEPIIPRPEPSPVNPWPGAGSWPWTPQLDLSELQKLIAEFREAVAAAKVVDKALGNGDCLDPEKAKLEARVRELEKDIEILKLRAEVDRLKREALVSPDVRSP